LGAPPSLRGRGGRECRVLFFQVGNSECFCVMLCQYFICTVPLLARDIFTQPLLTFDLRALSTGTIDLYNQYMIQPPERGLEVIVIFIHCDSSTIFTNIESVSIRMLSTMRKKTGALDPRFYFYHHFKYSNFLSKQPESHGLAVQLLARSFSVFHRHGVQVMSKPRMFQCLH
jgi:hypothetical protein